MKVKEFILSFIPGTGYTMLPKKIDIEDEHPFDQVVSSKYVKKTHEGFKFGFVVSIILCISIGMVGRYIVTLLAKDTIDQFQFGYVVFVLLVSILAFGQFHDAYIYKTQKWVQAIAAISMGTFFQSIIDTGFQFLK